MTRLRILGLAALVVLALSAITATAAEAKEGPFWRIEGKRLLKGEKANIKAKAGKSFVLNNPTSGIIITCPKLHLEHTKQAVLLGSTGLNFGSSEEIILFESCVVEGNGTPCEPENKYIITEPVTNKLDFETNELKEKEKLLVLFQPVKGTLFVKIKFAGAGCKIKEISVEGSVSGEAWQGGKAVTKGAETEAVVNEINFPSPSQKVVWLEEEGVKKEVKPKLTAGGTAATLTGRTEIELESKAKWGVLTK